MPAWPVQTEEAVWEEHIYQFQLSDPLFGGPIIDPVTKQGIDNFPLVQLANRTKWLRGRVDDLSRETALTVTVGATGDFATINAALTELSRYRLAHGDGSSLHTITLQSGFVMEEQVIARSVNLSGVRIQAEDAVVTIARDALTIETSPGSYPAFTLLDGAFCPVIAALFEMDATGSGSGRHGLLSLRAGGVVVFDPGAGIRNAGGNGAMVYVSTLRAGGCDFSGAGGSGVVGLNMSTMSIGSANVSGAAGNGLELTAGSLAEAQSLNATGCGVSGVRLQRNCAVNLYSANVRKGGSDSSSDLVVLQGSIASAHGLTGGLNITPNTPTSSGIIFQ